jgi:hypothetical protein
MLRLWKLTIFPFDSVDQTQGNLIQSKTESWMLDKNGNCGADVIPIACCLVRANMGNTEGER